MRKNIKTGAENDYILTMSCDDRIGLVHDVTSYFKESRYNITELDQYVDKYQKRFFMRIQFTPQSQEARMFQHEYLSDVAELISSEETSFKNSIPAGFTHFFTTLNSGTVWQLHAPDEIVKAAIFVSKESHCLLDILSRSMDGELKIEIPVIISNHEYLRGIADRFGIPFYHIPVSEHSRGHAEQQQLELIDKYKIELVILAKYMQILSPDFTVALKNRIVNIHHSFLPAFPGARPYHSAYQRGVKIIGATSHFVTDELDAGPIIEQDVIRIRHTDSIEDLKRKGKEVEKNVLSRAIWYYTTRRILAHENKTIIF